MCGILVVVIVTLVFSTSPPCALRMVLARDAEHPTSDTSKFTSQRDKQTNTNLYVCGAHYRGVWWRGVDCDDMLWRVVASVSWLIVWGRLVARSDVPLSTARRPFFFGATGGYLDTNHPTPSQNIKHPKHSTIQTRFLYGDFT